MAKLTTSGAGSIPLPKGFEKRVRRSMIRAPLPLPSPLALVRLGQQIGKGAAKAA